MHCVYETMTYRCKIRNAQHAYECIVRIQTSVFVPHSNGERLDLVIEPQTPHDASVQYTFIPRVLFWMLRAVNMLL